MWQELDELGRRVGLLLRVEVIDVQQGALVLQGHLHPRREVAGRGLEAQALSDGLEQSVYGGPLGAPEGELEVPAGESCAVKLEEALDEQALAHPRHALQVTHDGGLGGARLRRERRSQRRELLNTTHKLVQRGDGHRRGDNGARLGEAKRRLPDKSPAGGVLVQRGVLVPVPTLHRPRVELHDIPQRAALGVHLNVEDVEAVDPLVLLVAFMEAARGEGA